jgi:spore maturation protein CgeB
MRLLFVGPLWDGSTALQRANAFKEIVGVEVVTLDSMDRIGKVSFADRVRHRIRLPADQHGINTKLVTAASELRPDVIFIDSVRVITPITLRTIRQSCNASLVFYSCDDIAARHNSSRQLEACDQEWDIFFTTKSFNVAELKARGVRRPVLVGNAFDPEVHRPWTAEEIGNEFERFDSVFIGTCEADRMRTLNKLAQAGFSVVLHGNGWVPSKLHPQVTLRPPVYAQDYSRALHSGKLALCFLRKLNRDLVTTRSIELPGAARPMIAEKTREHDELFEDGRDYVSFSNDTELTERVGALLSDDAARKALAQAGRERCIRSGYSTIDRASEMIRVIQTNVSLQ